MVSLALDYTPPFEMRRVGPTVNHGEAERSGTEMCTSCASVFCMHVYIHVCVCTCCMCVFYEKLGPTVMCSHIKGKMPPTTPLGLQNIPLPDKEMDFSVRYFPYIEPNTACVMCMYNIIGSCSHSRVPQTGGEQHQPSG